MVRRPKYRQIRPARIYETITTLMEHRVEPRLKVQQPVWYKVVETIPPSEILTRPLPPQHHVPYSKAKKPSRLFQPQHLWYPEDQLRREFYKDHPWELARPRMIVELDGKDALRCDWSKGLRQPGMALSGECVVQRQLWLMEHRGLSKAQAYDITRREFYNLRREEQIERRIAQEEARMVGSYFGQTFLQVGETLEDQQYEKWRKWATRQIDSIHGEQAEANNTLSDDAEVDELSAQIDQMDETESS